jgi:hypothetical protein
LLSLLCLLYVCLNCFIEAYFSINLCRISSQLSALPGGIVPRYEKLKELVKEEKIDYYEIFGSRNLVFYWRGMNGMSIFILYANRLRVFVYVIYCYLCCYTMV